MLVIITTKMMMLTRKTMMMNKLEMCNEVVSCLSEDQSRYERNCVHMIHPPE
jgi:hypothetical protein